MLFSNVYLFIYFCQVYESDTAGHGDEDGEPRREPWHEAWHAAWHGRTGRLLKLLLDYLKIKSIYGDFTNK